MADYVYIPYIENPIIGNPEGWLRIGYNLAGRDAWLCSRTDTIIKCAYVQGSPYFYIVALSLISCNGIQQRKIAGQYGENISWSVTSHSYTGNLDLFAGDLAYTQVSSSMLNSEIPIYTTKESAWLAMDDGNWELPGEMFPISYRPNNCTFPNAPTEATVGDTVVVPVEFPDGYGLANPNDLYVQCNGVVVPSVYANGQLTFTMPDPS